MPFVLNGLLVLCMQASGGIMEEFRDYIFDLQYPEDDTHDHAPLRAQVLNGLWENINYSFTGVLL